MIKMTQLLVDTGAPFLKETSEIASVYVNLCFDKNPFAFDSEGGQARSPATDRSQKLATSSDTSGGPPPISPAYTIAQKLKEIGDKIDEKVKREFERALTDELKLRPSIIQLGHEQFSGMCRRVLTSCSDYLQNGWEQATVVFMGVYQVAGVLRTQRDQESIDQREAMISRFAGETLQDLRLDSWINSHGGMREFGSKVDDDSVCVPIESSV